MTNAIGMVGASIGVIPAASASPSSAAGGGASQTATNATQLHNPRVVQDPSAGYITEYLSADGSQVVSQTPSAITVAYLRQGMNADGMGRRSEASSGSVTV